MINVILAMAIALWGIALPNIEVEFFSNDIGIPAQSSGPLPDNRCLIGVYEPGWNHKTDQEKLSLMIHEVGHCAGLSHYGSCNYNPSIMGCASLQLITSYDRAMVGYHLTVPTISSE